MHLQWSNSKWSATAASIWIQCAGRSGYCLSAYFALLKSSHSYSQYTLAAAAAAAALANVGFFSVLLLSDGAEQSFAGYSLGWLSVAAGILPRPPVPLMCLYMLVVVAAHSMTLFSTARVVIAVSNFPSRRGEPSAS